MQLLREASYYKLVSLIIRKVITLIFASIHHERGSGRNKHSFKCFFFFRSGNRGANVQYAIFITQTLLTIQTRTYGRGYREEQIFNPALFVFAVYLEVEKSRCAGRRDLQL